MIAVLRRAWIPQLILLLPAAIASAQPEVSPPQVGFIEDGARALRPVFGIASNFILGTPVAANVVTQVFSGSLGLLKTGSSLTAFDPQGTPIASVDAEPGPALFAFSPARDTALIYLPSSNSLIEWRGGRFASVPVDCPGTRGSAVLALAFPNPFEALFIVEKRVFRGAGDLWEMRLPLNPPGIPSQKALPGVRAPVLVLPSGDLVYSASGTLTIQRSDASQVQIAGRVPARFSLQQMSRDWIELADLEGSDRFAIHIAPGQERLYRLPSDAPEQ
jgi:hypothetical protein